MVNTFIVSSDPKKCAKALDNKRLGKQRVEAYQIINLLEHKDDTKKGFSNHPATQMWKPYLAGLKYYYNCIVEEWIDRGFNNTMKLYDDVSEDDLLFNELSLRIILQRRYELQEEHHYIFEIQLLINIFDHFH